MPAGRPSTENPAVPQPPPTPSLPRREPLHDGQTTQLTCLRTRVLATAYSSSDCWTQRTASSPTRPWQRSPAVTLPQPSPRRVPAGPGDAPQHPDPGRGRGSRN
ncbi:hypothetical protein SAVERM_485 [Streptomyces avermitilis MA-4680 = NBRC 14893]|uniref:Uncharacterized protein n=1 Tax=Streptomyces avermitilis (strain ATCC 31267 / DSM 46492 / JCM 5070 / NBRC 14893 / NCIMB 12804 / NRRL 8165 / MA-4680) TaxID=227882 RepID=Q82QM0_STRAW|nr:hypothetical protein SAVERM_485 [Streptomyces avermitilis MA-4680 = NBRC 14893]